MVERFGLDYCFRFDGGWLRDLDWIIVLDLIEDG